MAEQLNLATPFGADPGSLSIKVTSLLLDWEGAFIRARFVANNARRFHAEWSGQTALSLMIALNKANLTSNSLHKRVIERAVADGKLPAGSVNGTPD